MHSFHHSRSRIFFEIFCALTISASCAIAWTQTGASALLPVAAVAALYSLVLAKDAGRRPKAVAVAAPLPEPIVEASALVSIASQSEEAPAAEQEPKAPARPKRKSRKKEIAPALAPEPSRVQLVVDEPEEEHHAPIAPLFERQPLVAQQRPMFGRKAG